MSTIDHDDFVAQLAAGAIAVVDVREPHEFAAGHVPGAVNLPLSQFDPEALPDGKPIVLICAAGVRSAHALSQAQASGRQDIVHYLPGTNGWRMYGGAIAR